MLDAAERFLRYIQINTTSDEKSGAVPSTTGQLTLSKMIAEELRGLGLKDVVTDTYGCTTATIPANCGTKSENLPVIGFIAHLDTSPDFAGAPVKAQIVENYQGGDILLNKEPEIRLKVEEFPELRQYIGQDLLTTDGTTLLGADDKAGVAEIVSAAAYLISHPEIKHGKIRLAFTPDEEIGRGTNHFDLTAFGADFAYTVDGGELGQLEAENFNAATATFTIHGKNVHPGTAKNKMVNSQLALQDLLAFFPPKEIPAHTEGYEGFYHLTDIQGTVEKTVLRYLIRDHDRERFEKRKEFVRTCREALNRLYGYELVELELKDTYYNMKEILDKHPHVVQLAAIAMEGIGVIPLLTPIRGGTDGARLSFLGLPTPNLFTGGHNFHGKYEFIPIQSMDKAVQTIVKICELAANDLFI